MQFAQLTCDCQVPIACLVKANWQSEIDNWQLAIGNRQCKRAHPFRMSPPEKSFLVNVADFATLESMA